MTACFSIRRPTLGVLFTAKLLLAGCSSTEVKLADMAKPIKLTAVQDKPLTNSKFFPEDQSNVCQIFQKQLGWYQDAIEMQNKWGTPIPLAMAFVKQESSFIHNARPIKRDSLGNKIGYISSAYGYAQALDGTWEDFIQATNDNVERTDFYDALQFIGWYTSLSKQNLNLSFDDVYHHYLAYHEGRRGFLRGRHLEKAFLLDAAKKVAKQAKIYKKQLSVCQNKLEKDKENEFSHFARNK